MNEFSSGAQVDCGRLIANFNACGSLLYKDFVKEWQKMKFSLIFRGRSTIYDLLDFTEEIFLIAKTYLFPPHSMAERIGGLYLLYGLYFRQPAHSRDSGFVKIRIEYNEWLILKEFISKVKALGYLDSCYIFYKLVVDNAFHFVCFTTQYGIAAVQRKKPKRNQIDLSAPKLNKANTSSIVDDLLNGNDFKSLWRKKESEYSILKKEIIERDLVDNSVKMDECDFVDSIKNSINAEPEKCTGVEEELSIGSRRQAIKSRKKGDSDLAGLGVQRSRLAHLKRLMMENIERKNEEIEQAESVSSQEGTSSRRKQTKASPRKYSKKLAFVNDVDSDQKLRGKDSRAANEKEDVCTRNMPLLLGDNQVLREGDLNVEEFEESFSSSDDESVFVNSCSQIYNKDSEKDVDGTSNDNVDSVSLMLFR